MSPNAARPADRKQKVLVYLFGSLGDSIVAIPALRAVRRHFPEAEIVMLQNFQSGNIVLASQVIPPTLVDRYLSYKSTSKRLGRISEFCALWLKLRRERFGTAIYLVLSERPERSVVRDRNFFRSCGIRELAGFLSYTKEELYPVVNGHPALTTHEAVRKLQRLEHDGIETRRSIDLLNPLLAHAREDIEAVNAWIDEKRQRPGATLISFGPGCKTQANAWPLEDFKRLGERLMETANVEIVVVGGPQEREMGDKLVKAWGAGMNAAGRFSVAESGALLSRCGFHVGLDTGTTHLAAAAGTRCFVIFGERENHGQWYPLGSGHTVVYHKVACAGCRYLECRVPGHPCMSGITVDAVWPHLRAFANENADPSSFVREILV